MCPRLPANIAIVTPVFACHNRMLKSPLADANRLGSRGCATIAFTTPPCPIRFVHVFPVAQSTISIDDPVPPSAKHGRRRVLRADADADADASSSSNAHHSHA